MEEPVSARENRFQLEVIERLTDLRAGQEELRAGQAAAGEHLAKLNGNVAAHEKFVTAHPLDCPLRGELGQIRLELASAKGAELGAARATGRWERWMVPITLALAASAIGICWKLILIHGPVLVK